MSFLFETHEVMVPTTLWVQMRLVDQRGGWVHGGTGTGKSHAVRAAVKGGISIDVASGPLLGQAFAVALAQQIGDAGKELLQAVRRRGLAAALSVATACLATTPLVVDRAERLVVDAPSPDDPAAALWQEDRRTVLDWLTARLEQTPTFLVGRGHPSGVGPAYRHDPPSSLSINLRDTTGDLRDWSGLAALARHNPAALTLARALVPLVPAADFNALVEQAREDELTGIPLLQRLGQAFRANAPPSWQRVLGIVATLGGAPLDLMELLLAERVGPVLVERVGRPGARVAPSEARVALDRLRELQLVEEHQGLLAPLPALKSAEAIRPLARHEHTTVLSTTAHALLAPLNDLRSLQPRDADRVFRAHALFVELGDMPNAERTAQLHLHGLVALARRTSKQDENWPEAFRQYDGILRMLQSDKFCSDDQAGRRLVSYVRHYRAWNGSQAGLLDDATCLEEYAGAVDGWPENAFWHQRLIEAHLRLGRVADARRAVEEGYRWVEPHPRRDDLLRVHPARVALSTSSSYLFSLELIEPLLELPEDLHPDLVDGCHIVLDRWAAGLPLSELPFPATDSGAGGRVVLHQEARVSVQQAVDPLHGDALPLWIARLDGVTREGRAAKPLGAAEALARDLAVDTRRLVSTPTSRLDAKAQRRKGLLLSLVDVLNSDIGLEHTAERWIVGRIEGATLIPTMRDLPQVEIPQGLLPESAAGLYFVKVPVLRDGAPAGPATAVRPAGRSLSPDALLTLLAEMSEPAA